MEIEELKHKIISLQKELNNEKGEKRKLIESKYSEKLFDMMQEGLLTSWECNNFVSKLIDEIHKLESL